MKSRRLVLAVAATLVAVAACGPALVREPVASPAAIGAAPTLARGGYPVVVSEVTQAALFPDEDARVRAAVASWLSASTPLSVVPAARVEQIRARAVAGENLDTGEACGAATHAHSGYDRVLGEYDEADVIVECEAACTLTVDVHRRAPGETRFGAHEATFSFSAPIEGAPTAQALEGAIRKLRPRVIPEEDGNGGLLLGGVSSGPLRVRGSTRVSLWKAEDPTGPKIDDKILAPAQALFDRCYVEDGGQEMFLFSTDASGHVDRCEPRPWNAARSTACVCAAISTLPWPARAFRRGFDVVFENPDVVTADGHRVSAYVDEPSDEEVLAHPWLQGWHKPPSTSMERCFANDPPLAKVQAPVTWDIGPHGESRGVRVAWEGGSSKEPTRACVEKILRQAVFPCPPREQTSLSVTTTLHASTSRPGRP
jgi:hypothetical protein